MYYNCIIIDLYERFAVAKLNESHTTINTLKIALKRNKIEKGLIFHNDQKSQFTSKDYNNFCTPNYVQQSMYLAGCLYDNTLMEQFYNTIKNEILNPYRFDTTVSWNRKFTNSFMQNIIMQDFIHTTAGLHSIQYGVLREQTYTMMLQVCLIRSHLSFYNKTQKKDNIQ